MSDAEVTLEGTDWRKPEEAPIGTPVLVFGTDAEALEYGRENEDAYIYAVAMREQDGTWWVTVDDPGYVHLAVIGWRPLPEPPTTWPPPTGPIPLDDARL